MEGSSTAKNWHSAGLPNITGSFGRDYFIGTGTTNGVFQKTDEKTHNNASSTTSTNKSYIITFDAKNSSSIYGNSSTVQPKSYTVLYIMKVKA